MKNRCLFGAAAVLLACSSLSAGATTLPERIEKTKVVKVAISPGYPPLETRDGNSGELVGFDIDLLAAIAGKLGVKLDYVVGTFETLVPALQTGRADMIMSGFYDRPARQQWFDFIDYLKAGAQFYSLANAKDLKDIVDLCGKTITAGRGTSYPDVINKWSEQNCVGAGMQPITIIFDTDIGQQVTNVKTGRAAAGVLGLESVPTVMENNPGTFKALGNPLSAALMGMAFDKKDPQLRDAFMGAFTAVIADGQYDALIKKWKLDLSAYTDRTVNAGQ